MNILVILSTFLVLLGQVIFWFITDYKQEKYKSKQIEEREKIIAELSASKQKIKLSEYLQEECNRLNNQLRSLQNINSSLEADLREANARLESAKLHSHDKICQMIDREKRLSEQFENLANRIFAQTNRQFDEQNRQSIGKLLIPLREQLDGFSRQVQDSFSQESRERHTLEHEIKKLQKLNATMAEETVNLTRALKGSNKIQGNWGELILSRVLEASGLREGYEYETQVNIENDSNERMQPDVIVHLPQEKDVIIDSKMTLVAYERYFNAKDENIKELSLQEHVTAFRNHIRQLGRKNYQHLPGLRTLDYALMFIPIDSAFLIAIDRYPELIIEALHNNIMLVSPSTLLVALRTISNLWKYEHQSQNAEQIAKRASKLYDKMRLFVDDIILIGKSLDHAQNSYCQAMKKLTSGRGNLLSQIEKFRSLGVDVKREINPQLIEKATDRNEENKKFNTSNSKSLLPMSHV